MDGGNDVPSVALGTRTWRDHWALSTFVVFIGAVVAYRTYQMRTRGWINFDWGLEGVLVYGLKVEPDVGYYWDV